MSIKGLLVSAAIAAGVVALYHNGVLNFVPGMAGQKK